MTETTAEKKHITIGILAHVDAGKTTLSEAKNKNFASRLAKCDRLL